MGSKYCRHSPRYLQAELPIRLRLRFGDLLDGQFHQRRGEMDGVVHVGDGDLLLGIPGQRPALRQINFLRLQPGGRQQAS